MDLNSTLNRSLTNSQIYDGEYFEVVSNDGDILVVRCNICTPDGSDGQLLRTSIKSNGNILKHIKRRHSELLEKIKSSKSVKSRAPRNHTKREPGMEDIKPFKKKIMQVKIKKQPDELDESETRVYISNDAQDPFNNPDEMYVIEPIEATESEPEDFMEYELENSRHDDRSIELTEENSSILNNEYEYIRKTSVKRVSEPNVSDGTPSYKRISLDRSLIEFQKKLMQMEFDDIKKLRHEKHQMEMTILKAELTHKTMEHQKQMELLNKKLQE